MGKGKKKKILYLIDFMFGGGAELVVTNLCRHIDANRFEVCVCGLKNLGTRGDELKNEGYDVFKLPAPICRAGKYFSSLKLKRIVRDKGIDLIHSHSTQGLVDGGLVKLFTRKVRHVHTFHFGNYPFLDRNALLLERIFSKIPDRLIAVGEEQKLTLEKTFRLSEGKINKIWNGIEVNPAGGFNKAGYFSRNIGNEKVIFASISTLIEQKGIPYLLDAVSLLGKRRRDFQVWIVGDGHLRGELEKKAATLGIKDIVEFKGWVHNASREILSQVDIFIQSSLWEAMSMVLMEAMATGKAVIATDVGDNGHVINNGESGIIVKRKDIESMANSMSALIDNREMRERLGSKAREKIIRDCSVERMARNYENLYTDLLNTRI